MRQLVIEYVLEGQRRGYNFTSPTRDYDDEILKAIWRSAMPRGQGWGIDTFVGARSIKAFTLPDDRIAVSEVTVTDLVDEGGRRGIRRAVVDVMTARVYTHHLRSRLAGYPADVQVTAERQRAQVERSMPRLKRDTPFVLAAAFTDARAWWVMEALVIGLAAAPPRALRRWGDAIPFTTLALDYRDETKIVALPAGYSAQLDGVPVVDVG